MPNLKSAKKRMRTDAKKRIHNRSVKSDMRTLIKSLKNTIASGNKETAAAQLSEAFSKIDRAVKRNLIHRNSANRTKASLAQSVSQIQ